MTALKKIEKNNIEDILPLTPIQEGLLFHYIKDPRGDLYFEQILIHLEGEIDSTLFNNAWQAVMKFNPCLRTVFRWEKLLEPVQIVMKNRQPPVVEYDFSRHPDKKKQTLMQEVLENDRKQGIDISCDPFRLTLCTLDKSHYELIVSNHHILYDGWSTGIILKEFLQAYESLSEGKEINHSKKSSYRDYIVLLKNKAGEKGLEFWKQYLAGYDKVSLLPLDKRKPGINFTAGELTKDISPGLVSKIFDFTKEFHITLATLVYAAWGILLKSYTSFSDIVFGTTVSDRSHSIEDIQDIVGLFINTIPLRIVWESGETVLSFIQRVDKAVKDREEYMSIALPDIKGCSDIDGRGTLFDSIVVVENYPLDRMLTGHQGKIRGKGKSTFAKTHYDLSLVVSVMEKVEVRVIYNRDVFYRETIQRIISHFLLILKGLTGSPHISLTGLKTIPDDEINRLLMEFNNTKTGFPKNRTLCELFEEQAAKLPGKTALLLDRGSMTYRELNEKSNQLAHFLRSKGVQRNTIVGLFMERSFEMLTGIWGILKAGGAYLPLDTAYPAERIAGILQDAQAGCLLTHNHFLPGHFYGSADLKNIYNGNIYCIDEIEEELSLLSPENPGKTGSPEDPAYIMYTSGSTGKPKGIVTTHYNISRVVKKTNYIDMTESDVLLQLSNYAFDGSTFDIFGSLLNGATLVLMNRETVIDIHALSALIKEKKVSVFFITTALFNTLVDLDIEALQNVRKILFGGERVSFPHVKKAYDALGEGRIIHVYGPTETTVYATYCPVQTLDEDPGTVPIGKPVSNTECYVLDGCMNPVPLGAIGELYISGDGLARGYLNRPELTAGKFLPHPFLENRRIYKTGDCVKMLPSGDIVFLDRMDTQVKLRGYRVEPGEIESVCLSHESIKESVVTVREDESGNKFLCAFLVPERTSGLLPGDGTLAVKEFLARKLPYYMIPSYIIFLDKLPLTPNGKVDKKALSRYAIDTMGKGKTGNHREPANRTEEKLAALWREILGVDSISVHDNFFELGGHSLKAMILASRIHRELDTHIPLHEVLAHPTIKELSHLILNSGSVPYSRIVPCEEKEYYPLSKAQMAVYVQEQFEGIGTTYNIPLALSLEGTLDPETLQTAFKELVKRHEVLRTSFCIVDGRIMQKIHKTAYFKMHTSECNRDQVDHEIAKFVKPFDLHTAPLLRAKLLKINPEKHMLLFDMHHIISDGISLFILFKELTQIYNGETLPGITLHYKDFIQWQEGLFKKGAFEKSREYWMKTLSGELPVLHMPVDKKRGNERSFKGGCVRFSIPALTGRGIIALIKKENITSNTLFMSLYALLLSRYSNTDDVIIGSLVAGRYHADMETITGMFNNFIPLRIFTDRHASLRDYLRHNNSMIMEAYEHQDYPFSELVEDLSLPAGIARNPLFDTMLIIHNEVESLHTLHFDEASVAYYGFDHHTSKLDFKLDIYPDETKGGFECIMEYNVNLFYRETIERLTEHFMNIIIGAVSNPDVLLGEIGMLSPEEQVELLVDFNSTTS
ncbi:MAG: amino acid adenylation domain-containing protein, partial [Spirochaetales bacterium]|nr:amino acid adenylation domain-containing protein [Spirochaetales bacterium]